MENYTKTPDQLRYGEIIEYNGDLFEVISVHDRWGFCRVDCKGYSVSGWYILEIDKIELLTIHGNTYDPKNDYYKAGIR